MEYPKKTNRFVFGMLTIATAGFLIALTACTDDSGEPYSITGGLTGGACFCDSDCNDLGNWTAFCLKGVCVLEPLAGCASQNADTACPIATVCTSWEHEGQEIPICALECNNEIDRKCHVNCNEDGLCLPSELDNCLEGCCSVSDPPVLPYDTPEYPETEWEAPQCGPEIYPCPPYGTRKNRVMADVSFLPANDAAEDLAGDDEILNMKDFYSADARLIVIFVSAGWCDFCGAEAGVLNDVYESFEGDERGKVMFLGVVSQDGDYYYATTTYAKNYASSYGWTFPAVPDVSNVMNQYFLQPAYPFHLIVDGRDMTIRYSMHGALESKDLTNRIEQLLND